MVVDKHIALFLLVAGVIASAALLLVSGTRLAKAPSFTSDNHVNQRKEISGRASSRKIPASASGGLSSETLTIGAVGDILFESTLQRQAARQGSYAESWKDVIPLLQRPDIMFGNHEGTESFVESIPNGGSCERDEKGKLTCDLEFDDVDRGEIPLKYGRKGERGVFYSGGPYLQFNYHPKLANDLANSGFDVVSTANNHCLDRGHIGLNQTLDALDGAGIAHTGTRRAPDSSWYTIVEREGWSTAWVACTDATNYQRNGRDRHRHLVLNCFSPEMIGLVSNLAANPTIHAVVAVVHWGGSPPADDDGDAARQEGYGSIGFGGRGVVYQRQPDCSMKHFARELAEAGAVAILGMHPHVLHGWERYVTTAGKETILVHSLGNFVSHGGYAATRPPPAFLSRGYESETGELLRRTSALLQLGLRWDEGNNWAEVSCLSYVPLYRSLTDIGFVEKELAAEDKTTYEVHVHAPSSMHADGEMERAFVAEKFGPLQDYFSGGGSEDARRWEAEVDADGIYKSSCYALRDAPVTTVDGSIHPSFRHYNADGSSTSIASEQCLKCEQAEGPGGCRWCQYKPFSYCTGSSSTKIDLGEKIPWDTCLRKAAENPDCSEWAYAGGDEGKCTCMRKGMACNIARSTKYQSVYLHKCGSDP